MIQAPNAPREQVRLPSGDLGDVRAATQDVLRLMGLLLKMPLRIAARLEGSFYRVMDVLDEGNYGLRAGQVILGDDPLAALVGVSEFVQSTGDAPPTPVMGELGLRSYIGVPLVLSDGQMIGTLSAADTREHYFSPAIREGLVLLARMLSHEIERAERERELRVLAEISQAFVRQNDMDGTFSTLVGQAVRLFEADYCLLHRIDLAAGLITAVATHGVTLPLGVNRRLDGDDELAAIVQTARNKAICWIPDAAGDARPDPRFVARFRIAGILYAPLVVDDVTHGVLTVAHRDLPYLFSPALLRVVEILANEAALAIRRHQLWEEMTRRQEELAVLNQLSTLCTSRLELEPLLRGLANELRLVVHDASDCYIVLCDEDGGLYPAAASGEDHEEYRRLQITPGSPSISARVIETGSPVIIDDMSTSPYTNKTLQRQFPICAAIGVPLVAHGKTLGVALLGQSQCPRPWTDDEVARLQTAVNQVALSIANAQLYEETVRLAVHDGLTGVYNRRYLEQKLVEEMARSLRYDRALSCIMIDLDHFKRVNDTYGHDAGDHVLQEFARRLRIIARSNDVLARYGGEEFTMLLPETDCEDARRTAERIRGVIAGRPFQVEGLIGEGVHSIYLTCSLGVCERMGGISQGAELMRQADAALYRAKAAGRNCVICTNDEAGRTMRPEPALSTGF